MHIVAQAPARVRCKWIAHSWSSGIPGYRCQHMVNLPLWQQCGLTLYVPWDCWPHTQTSLSLKSGFEARVPTIQHTFVPPNGYTVAEHHVEFNAIIQHKFAKGQYLGPFSAQQATAMLGSFQTSLLSLVPKSIAGKFCLIQNLSFPHHSCVTLPPQNPTIYTTSINAAINSDTFLCTLGTFHTVVLLVACLPPGSQLATCDVAEAYCTIPFAPSQWPGTTVWISKGNSFAIKTSNCFGLASASGVWGCLADTLCTVFCVSGIGLVSKWVNDFVFFHLLVSQLNTYNACHAKWAYQICWWGDQQQDHVRL